MRKINITIEIHPLETCNVSEASRSNKVGNEIIQKITDVLSEIDTSKLFFDIKINSE